MPPADAAPLSGPSRALPRLLLAAAALLLLARVALGVWDATHTPETVDRVAWVGLAQAEAEARRSGRPVLYDFSAEWCGPCQAMQAEVFADPALAQAIERQFVPVRVTDRQREDGRNPAEVDSLQRAYGITGFPTLVVAVPGRARFESTSGYRGRDATVQWLTQAATLARMRSMGMTPDSTPPLR